MRSQKPLDMRTTVYVGMAELAAAGPSPKAAGTSTRRVRAEGGGRKKLMLKDTTLLQDLDALVEPTARGDPQSPLRWTCKSTPRLAEELRGLDHPVSQRTVYGNGDPRGSPSRFGSMTLSMRNWARWRLMACMMSPPIKDG